MRRVLLLISLPVLLAALVLPAFAASRGVRVHDFAFSPGRITVRKGTTVVWHFRGPSAHNVTVRSGPRHFHSRTRAHFTYRHRFTRRGTYRLFCTVHPFMTMRVRVR